MMQVIIPLVVNALAVSLPKLGVTTTSVAIDGFVQVVIAIGSAVWIYLTHRKVVKAARAAGVKGI